MAWLPDGEKIWNICLFVSTEYTNVTDGRTDGQTDRQTDRRTPHDGTIMTVASVDIKVNIRTIIS